MMWQIQEQLQPAAAQPLSQTVPNNRELQIYIYVTAFNAMELNRKHGCSGLGLRFIMTPEMLPILSTVLAPIIGMTKNKYFYSRSIELESNKRVFFACVKP